MIALAVLLAVVAACCFALSVAMQHGAVQESGFSLRVLKSRRWLVGTSLAVLGAGLHVVALWLAPLVIVQPIGVLSLVLTVLFSARGEDSGRQTWIHRRSWWVGRVVDGQMPSDLGRLFL
ncbi:hypothetical protein LWC34_28860 [Kibdelosporangium philippinense]|uniref:DUF3325 domain-containing protein n=1 Tax=Kibdelosporangium philippinense TaxID=211113 RepID=A0ABS8ZI91_9PSEU|nr:hypothetical protein [Kibdelosporangium philippinense]MCE7006808.1 hypothetical protein [Kibdelosporangium philippinense]